MGVGTGVTAVVAAPRQAFDARWRRLPRQAVRRPAWLAGVTVLLAAVPSASGENTADAHVTLSDLSAGLLVVLVAVGLVRQRRRLPRSLVLVAGGLTLAGLLAALTATDQPAALSGWLRFTELFVLIPVAVALSLRTRTDVLWVLVPLAALGVVEGLIGYRQHVTGTGASYAGGNGRAIGTFGAYEIMGMATVVGCALVALCAVALVARGRLRWAALAVAVALLAPLTYSYSRGVWIGTAVAVAVVVLVAGWRRGLVILAVLVLVLVLGLGSAGSAGNSVNTRLDTISTAVSQPDTSVNDRYGLWQAARAMWRDHPVTGVGIKNFALYRDRYAPASVSSTSDIADTNRGFRRVQLLTPHNLYLLILSEQGLAGALAYGAALLCLLVGGVRRFRRGVPDRLTRLIGVLAAGFGAWVLVTSLYGDPGGASTVMKSVLLGVPVWWALGRDLEPSVPRDPPLRHRPAPAAAASAGRLRSALSGGRSATVVGVGVLMMVASLLGLARDLVIARVFGASANTDAFLVAWTIPETATPLLMEGILGLFLVPMLARALQREGSLAGTVTRTLPTVLAMLAALTVGLVAAAPVLVRLLAPGLAAPGVAVTCFRIAALTVLSIGLCGYLMSVLKASSSFLVPAAANIAWNIGILACVAALSAVLGIYSAAIGLAVGAAAMAVIQIPSVVRRVGVPRLRLTLSRPLLLRSVVVIPVAVYALGRQAQTYAERFFGSQLGAGAISHLNFAFKVGQMAAMLSLVAAWVAFPAMARTALTDGRVALAGKLDRELRIALGLLMPQIGVLVLFAPQVIGVLFGHGRFGPADVSATATILQMTAVGLVGQVVLNIVVLCLFAADTADWAPARAAGIGLAVTVAVDAAGYRILGAPGLAAGTAVGILCAAALALRVLRRRAVPLDLRRLARFTLLCLLATGLGGLVAWALTRPLPPGQDFAALTLGTLTLGAVYAGVLRVATGPGRAGPVAHPRTARTTDHRKGPITMSTFSRIRGPLLLVSLAFAGAAAGLLLALSSPAKFTARSVTVVVPRNPATAASDLTPTNYAKAYGRVVTDPAVLGPALAARRLALTPEQAANQVTVSAAPDGPTIEIVATGATPAQAAELANVAASGVVGYSTRRQAETGVRAVALTPATPPSVAASPNRKLDMAVGAAVGLLIGGAWLALRPGRSSRPGSEALVWRPNGPAPAGPPHGSPNGAGSARVTTARGWDDI